MADERVIRPGEGWEHVACPKCGHVTTFPTERLREEGAPICVHSGGTVIFGRLRAAYALSDRWATMVPVLVIPVDAVKADLKDAAAQG